MRRISRFQVAAGVTVLFVGGTIAGGIALRPDASTNADATGAPGVIHQRKVKTISVPAGPAPGAASATETAVPVSVTSRTSPGGAGSAGGYESDDEGEFEHGESD